MSKKIIGVTVGTPISPNRIAAKIKPVKTVNGKAPDENGNVEIEKPTYTAKDVGALPAEALPEAINDALAQAKESGEFDGTDGKSAYEYAKDGGYAGTEAEFAEKLAFLMGYSVFGYVDENMDIILKGNITNGAYLKLEMEDGSKIDIAQAVLYYEVTNTLANCVNSNSATSVVKGGSYSATITANNGYELKSVSATMGGSAVSVSGGVINIASVTGDIVITAVAEEKAIEPSYTNLAKNFEVGRYKSSGEIDANTTDATACIDYIPFTPGTVVRIKGFGALDDYNCVHYKSDKTKLSSALATNTVNDTYHTYSYDSATGIVTLTSVRAEFGFIRFSGVLTGTTDDVIITVNEPIV